MENPRDYHNIPQPLGEFSNLRRKDEGSSTKLRLGGCFMLSDFRAIAFCNFGMATQTAGLGALGFVWDIPNESQFRLHFRGSFESESKPRGPQNQQLINNFNLNLLTKKKKKNTHTSYYMITYNFPKTPSPSPRFFVLFLSQKTDLIPPWMAQHAWLPFFRLQKATSGFSLLTITPSRRWGDFFSGMDGPNPAVFVTFD